MPSDPIADVAPPPGGPPGAVSSGSAPALVALYTITIFASAALLFIVQPLFARMVLPVLGGSPSVWNTAMLFYQAVLLAGYAYAHASLARFGVRRQAWLHLAVLALPFAVLPIALPAGWTPPADANPAPWLLALMAVAVGLPFFAVSATSPVLQRWFAATGHGRATDPYFLYAASNAGSLLALLAYPLAIEPQLRLGAQSRAWTWGYGGFVVLMAACAAWVWRLERVDPNALSSDSEPASGSGSTRSTAKPTPRQRARWVLLAFLPSSLLLGATNFLSTEVAVVPLLWVVPLAIYLLTFVLAFARRPWIARAQLERWLPILVAVLVASFAARAAEPLLPHMVLHLAGLFVAALLCHRTLAESRPAPAQLTEFYLWLSLGGVLGGIFNALLAPLLFDSLLEYPLALLLTAAVVLPGERDFRRGDWARPLLVGVATAAGVFALRATEWRTEPKAAGAIFGAAALGVFLLSRRPWRFVLAGAALLAAAGLHEGETGRGLRTERSFFGVHRVTLDPSRRYHLLSHGRTLHGAQSADPARARESLTYYHRTGPAGSVMAQFAAGAATRVGVVGLGVGSLAAFAQPGQAWTYFEIDPAVVRLAADERSFTFLRDAPARPRIVLGDARRTLATEPDAAFDVLVLDAYSSDAIPVHLVTREALALYRRTLAPGGVLAFHISNRHLDLEPVFAALAADAGLASLTRDDTNLTAVELQLGKSPSIWLVMARRPETLASLARDPRWQPSRRDPRLAVWTDDYSSLLSVFRWQQ
ncbi:MAG: fused MFS/spermidine synthase [Verrucomicrobia bacterium]|nr:fused MFS/spermidine synthase [Verrucomicrobiota bacterium]